MFNKDLPDTFNTHNWLFNIILIPRWLIIIGFLQFYWTKFPEIKNVIKQKFRFSDAYLKRTLINLSFLNVIYFFT